MGVVAILVALQVLGLGLSYGGSNLALPFLKQFGGLKGMFESFSLLEAMVLSVGGMLLSSTLISSEAQSGTLELLSILPLGRLRLVLEKLLFPLIPLAIYWLFSLLLSALWVEGPLSMGLVLHARVVLLTAVLSAMGVGLFWSAVCANTRSSVTLGLLSLAAFAGNVFFMGPLLRCLPTPEAAINLAIWVNPVVGMASALQMDILRTGWVYSLSPIGMYRFDYLPWPGVTAIQLALFLCFTSLSVWALKARTTFEDNLFINALSTTPHK